jgi:hypothetical protein
MCFTDWPTLIWQPDIFPDKEKEIAAKYFDVEIFNPQFHNPTNLKNQQFIMRGAVNTALRVGYSLDKFNSRCWVPYLSDYMISKNFWWDTAKQTSLKSDWMWPMFIRPDSGRKIFAGQVFTKEKWLEEYAFLKQRNTEKILVFCAEKENIGREWRCLFVGQELVGISDYMFEGNILDGEIGAGQRNITDKLKNFAHEIRNNDLFTLEDNLTIDIGQRKDGSYGLIEINFLESAGWYACDPETVFKALRKQFDA